MKATASKILVAIYRYVIDYAIADLSCYFNSKLENG
jgi:hypothetical protein